MLVYLVLQGLRGILGGRGLLADPLVICNSRPSDKNTQTHIRHEGSAQKRVECSAHRLCSNQETSFHSVCKLKSLFFLRTVHCEFKNKAEDHLFIRYLTH